MYSQSARDGAQALLRRMFDAAIEREPCAYPAIHHPVNFRAILIEAERSALTT